MPLSKGTNLEYSIKHKDKVIVRKKVCIYDIPVTCGFHYICHTGRWEIVIKLTQKIYKDRRLQLINAKHGVECRSCELQGQGRHIL